MPEAAALTADTADSAAPSRGLLRHIDGSVRVWILNVGLIGLALLLFRFLEPLPATPGSLQIIWPALAIFFALAEVGVVHFHFRQSSYTFSLNEVPLVIGLFLASPADLILGQVVGAALALRLHRRQPAIKLAYNLGKLALEAELAIIVFRGLAPVHPPAAAIAWGATFAATAVTAISGVLLTMVVISLLEGRLQTEKVLEVLAFGVVGGATNSSLALVAALVITLQPAGILLLAVPAGVLLAAYRAYTGERRKSESVESLYQSSRELQLASNVDAAVVTLLRQARGMFHVEHTEILMIHPDPDRQATRSLLRADDRVETALVRPDSSRDLLVLAEVGEHPVNLRAGVSPEVDRYLEERGLRSAIVAPLRSEARLMGTLTIGNRTPSVGDFQEDDRRLFEALAGHASTVLERDRLQEEFQHQALHDSLTGLANRNLFLDRTRHLLQKRREGNSAAILFLDLDDFKTINDSLGHHAGDQLLTAVAERLLSSIRPGDTAARLGGDEFAILLEDFHNVDGVIGVADRVLQALQSPFRLRGEQVRVHASVGVAIGSAHNDEQALLRNADVAMYFAKNAGKGRYAIFEESMGEAFVQRHLLKAELAVALERGEFEVHYQPIFEVGSNIIRSVEALVRWRNPVRGLVQPDSFIATAEETGLISEIGCFVLEEACRQLSTWRQAGGPRELTTHVNVSGRQLDSPAFDDQVLAIIRDSGLRGSDVVLEVTETVMAANPESTIRCMTALRNHGVRFAIDDFGTGYSSLSQLQRFPADIIKIAKQFVDRVPDDLEGNAFTRAIVRLGTTLNMQMVAEGVESEAQAEALKLMGCERAQGFFYSRALPAAAMTQMLGLGSSRGHATAV